MATWSLITTGCMLRTKVVASTRITDAHSTGPIWIHHNVIENVAINLIWMNEGRIDNMNAVNNTVFCSDNGHGSGNALDAWSEERLNNWRS